MSSKAQNQSTLIIVDPEISQQITNMEGIFSALSFESSVHSICNEPISSLNHLN
jgi:hypothetical protein